MPLRRVMDWALRGLTFGCVAAWTLLFFTMAVESMGLLFDGFERSATALRAVYHREPCAELFRRAGEALFQFAMEFGMSVVLAWAGAEMVRRSLVRKLTENGRDAQRR